MSIKIAQASLGEVLAVNGSQSHLDERGFRFAGHVLLNNEWLEQQRQHLPASNCLQQEEVCDAINWAKARLRAQESVAPDENVESLLDGFDPHAVGTKKTRRYEAAERLVTYLLEPYNDVIIPVKGKLALGRPKSAPSTLVKVNRRVAQAEKGDPRHPLRYIGDMYALMVVFGKSKRTGREFTSNDVHAALARIQSAIHDLNDAAAPDIALDGEPALSRGGNPSSAEGYTDWRLHFQADDVVDAHNDIPIELIGLTSEEYQIYRRTHGVYAKNRQAACEGK